MRHVLDTNVWIEAAAAHPEALAALKRAVEGSWAGYSSITRLELFGFPDLTDAEETELTALLKPFGEVAVSSAIVDRAIEIRRSSRIKIPDAIIAATALVHDAVLVTRNTTDFKGIDALTLLNPEDLAPEMDEGSEDAGEETQPEGEGK